MDSSLNELDDTCTLNSSQGEIIDIEIQNVEHWSCRHHQQLVCCLSTMSILLTIAQLHVQLIINVSRSFVQHSTLRSKISLVCIYIS